LTIRSVFASVPSALPPHRRGDARQIVHQTPIDSDEPIEPAGPARRSSASPCYCCGSASSARWRPIYLCLWPCYLARWPRDRSPGSVYPSYLRGLALQAAALGAWALSSFPSPLEFPQRLSRRRPRPADDLLDFRATCRSSRRSSCAPLRSRARLTEGDVLGT
jgi:hypothetical protein